MRALPAVFVIAVWWAGTAVGATFQVSPIRIMLSQQSTSALLSVRNDGAEKVRFQVGVFEWDETPEGEMRLHPTEDLIFYPNLLAIDPGDERNIRVGTKKPVVASEKSYRIFVEELPSLEKPEGSGIQILTKMGVPIFIQPVKRLLQPQVEGMKLDGSEFSFRVKNAGNTHFFPRSIRVLGTGAEGERLLDQQLQAWYILSGGTRKYAVPIAPAECAKLQNLTVEVVIEGKTLTEVFPVQRAACH